METLFIESIQTKIQHLREPSLIEHPKSTEQSPSSAAVPLI
jgi:hypothetical protein